MPTCCCSAFTWEHLGAKAVTLRLIAASLLSLPTTTAASDAAESLAELRLQVARLADRVAALEGENQAMRKTAVSRSEVSTRIDPDAEAADDGRFRLAGDFRYRYEDIDEQGRDDHKRTRIRARANVESDLSDELTIGFGLATGGASPTSSTQTLGDGGSKKEIALDLAYADWTPVEGLHVQAGKIQNPMIQVPSHTVMWDDEWRPQGLALRYRNEILFATFLGTWLESDSLAPAREWAAGAHGGIYRPFGRNRLTAGVGYFEFDTTGKGTFSGSDVGFAGNEFDCANPLDTTSCVHVLDYREMEFFAALDVERDAYSTMLYGHYVQNLDAERLDSGWTAGVRLQTYWQGQPLQFDYFYRSLDADAVYGQLTDSDFGGGGSDAEGHYMKAGITISPGWQLSLAWFDNRIGAGAGMARDYHRLQLNADFSY